MYLGEEISNLNPKFYTQPWKETEDIFNISIESNSFEELIMNKKDNSISSLNYCYEGIVIDIQSNDLSCCNVEPIELQDSLNIRLENFTGYIKLTRDKPLINKSRLSHSTNIPNWLQQLVDTNDEMDKSDDNLTQDIAEKSCIDSFSPTTKSNKKSLVKTKRQSGTYSLWTSSTKKPKLFQDNDDAVPEIMDDSVMLIESSRSCRSIARWGHTASVVSDNSIIEFGGIGSAGYSFGDILKYSHFSGNQISVKRLICGDRPRAWHTAIFVPEKSNLVCFGGEFMGDDEQLKQLDDVLLYDPSIDIWFPAQSVGKGPISRSGHCSGLLLDRLIIIYGGQKQDRFIHNINVLDSTTWHWSAPKADGKPPKARIGHSCCNLSSTSLIYFGGNDLEQAFNDVHVLTCNEKGHQWIWDQPEVSGDIPTCRSNHSAVMFGPNLKFMFIRGGYNNTLDETIYLTDSYVLDTSKWIWYRLTLDDENFSVVSLDTTDLQGEACSFEFIKDSPTIGRTCERAVYIKDENKNDNCILLIGGQDRYKRVTCDVIRIYERDILKKINDRLS